MEEELEEQRRRAGLDVERAQLRAQVAQLTRERDQAIMGRQMAEEVRVTTGVALEEQVVEARFQRDRAERRERRDLRDQELVREDLNKAASACRVQEVRPARRNAALRFTHSLSINYNPATGEFVIVWRIEGSKAVLGTCGYGGVGPAGHRAPGFRLNFD